MAIARHKQRSTRADPFSRAMFFLTRHELSEGEVSGLVRRATRFLLPTDTVAGESLYLILMMERAFYPSARVNEGPEGHRSSRTHSVHLGFRA